MTVADNFDGGSIACEPVGASWTDVVSAGGVGATAGLEIAGVEDQVQCGHHCRCPGSLLGAPAANQLHQCVSTALTPAATLAVGGSIFGAPQRFGHCLDRRIDEQPVGRAQVQASGPRIVERLHEAEGPPAVAGLGLGSIGVDHLRPSAHLPCEVVGTEPLGKVCQRRLVVRHRFFRALVAAAGEHVSLVSSQTAAAAALGEVR